MNLFYKVWFSGLIVKLVIGTLLPLFSDEAYYWVWSHHLQLSYFDHPPMIGWLLSLTHPLEPFGSLIRLPIILLSHLTLLVWREILKDILSEKQMIWFLALSLLNPLFGWGGIIATPDVPMLFFWSTSLLFAKKYLEAPSTKLAVLLGSSLGLGFCAKYHIAIFPIILFAWITLNKKWKNISLGHILTCTVFGILFSLPVLVWNFQNNFDSFLFQLNHGLKKVSNVSTYPIQYLTGQVLLLFPVTFWFFIKKYRDYKNLIYVFAFVPLAFFFMTSFKSRVEANWPIIAYPAVFAIFAQSQSKPKWINATLVTWATLFVFTVLSVFVYTPDFLKNSKIKEINQYNVLAGISKKYSPLYAGSYQAAASLSFLEKKQIYKLPKMNRRDFYDYLNMTPPKDESYYLIIKNDQAIPEFLSNLRVNMIEELGSFQVFEISEKAK